MAVDPVRKLREAVATSPDNAPLRVALAEMLMSLGRADEAERAYRDAEQLSPTDASIKLGLATAFFDQGKNSHALVVVEGLMKGHAPPAAPDCCGRGCSSARQHGDSFAAVREGGRRGRKLGRR
jgi:hypothetical protein